jgi:hypothetical protein
MESKINTMESKIKWNDKLEHVVVDIGESSRAYKIMHIEVAQNTSKQYSLYMMAGIILGPISGVISAIGIGVGNNIGLTITSAIFSFLSGIIIAIIKFNKFDEMISANKSAAAKYTSLESNVRRQLAVYRDNRVEAGPYLEWLNTTYETLFSSAPLLPMAIQNAYVKKAEKDGVHIPSIYSNVIDINTGYVGVEHDDIYVVDENSTIHKEITRVVNNAGEDDIKTLRMSYDLPLQTKIKTSSSRQLPELEEYSDGLMSYQMKRLLGKL